MTQHNSYHGREIFIVDGNRTPFLKVRSKLGPFSGTDLAVQAARTLLNRQPFSPEDLDEVIVGSVAPSLQDANVARVIALRAGCGDFVPAYTVARNCASGMQALDSAAKDIAEGRADLVMAGGTEAMSHTPIPISKSYTNWLGEFTRARSLVDRAKIIAKFRPGMLVPVSAGLVDPLVGLSMGQTAENLAERFNISREAMDQYSAESHRRLATAQEQGWLTEMTPIIDSAGNVFDHDDGVRADTTVEGLATLKPVFDKKYGSITAGNSSQLTDGACMLILASADAVKKYNLPVLGRIVDCNWAALSPAIMGLGPTCASTPLMHRHKLAMKDIDYWEINEAFAAQVLGCVAAWQDKVFCQERFDSSKAVGELDMSRLNVDGGAVAMGHPIGTSGARIVLHLLHVLERNNAKRGIASICIGGGQGGAVLLER